MKILAISIEEAQLGRAVYMQNVGTDDRHHPGIISSRVYIDDDQPMVTIKCCNGNVGHKYLINLMLCRAGDYPYGPQ